MNPDLPDDPALAVPAAEHYARKFGPRFREVQGRVAQAAAAEGIAYDGDRILVANTLRAHRLLWLAGEAGGPDLQERLVEALFRAYFAEGRNVSDPETLAAIAGGSGMDEAQVRTGLAGEQGRVEVSEQLQRAQEMGVTAVPTFVFGGRWAVVGAQEPETLLDVLQQLVPGGGPGASGAAGGAGPRAGGD